MCSCANFDLFFFIQIISSIVDTVYTWHCFETLTHKVLLSAVILAFLLPRLMGRVVSGVWFTKSNGFDELVWVESLSCAYCPSETKQ